jgi:thiol:disulfide interchange protein DsbA
MNCETIDSILDDHLVARLNPSERKRAAEHVMGCARCTAAWAADDALRGETFSGPAPELFAAVLRRVAAAPVQRRAAARGLWWWAAGAAAAVAVVAVAARFSFVEPEPSAPAAGSSAALTAVDASRFVAGRGYEVLPGSTATATVGTTGKIEVTEFFMFFCFPCYAFEPELDRWEARAPSDVSLTRVPALFNAKAELQARAYYTAEVLGKLDAMRNAFYDEIHERGNDLASRASLEEFFGRFGVDAGTFDAAFDSSDVDARMQHAVALNREYAVTATPTLVVAGRYATNPTLAREAITTSESVWPTMLAVVDRFVAATRACLNVEADLYRVDVALGLRCVEKAQR